MYMYIYIYIYVFIHLYIHIIRIDATVCGQVHRLGGCADLWVCFTNLRTCLPRVQLAPTALLAEGFCATAAAARATTKSLPHFET